jgi:hypothetical protein
MDISKIDTASLREMMGNTQLDSGKPLLTRDQWVDLLKGIASPEASGAFADWLIRDDKNEPLPPIVVEEFERNRSSPVFIKAVLEGSR